MPAWFVCIALMGCHTRPAEAPHADACSGDSHAANSQAVHLCVKPDGVKDGPATYFYENGLRREAGAYRNNKRHGHWTFWQENGALWQEGDWQDGEVLQLKPVLPPCAPDTRLNGDPPPKGRALWCQRHLSDGSWRNHGPFMSWHADGRPQAQGRYNEAEPDGDFTMWFPDGQIKARGAYEVGEEQGLWLSWHDNGHLFIRAIFEHGKENGPWVSWWEEGSKSAEGQFEQGLEDGHWTFWHSNGHKSEEGNYTHGKKEGWWRVWDLEGHEVPMEEFRGGLRTGSAPRR